MKIYGMYGVDVPSGSATGQSSNNGLRTNIPNGPWETSIGSTETALSWSAVGGSFIMSLRAFQYNFGNYRFRIHADLRNMNVPLSPTSNIFLGARVAAGAGFTGSQLFGLSYNYDISGNVPLALRTELPAFALNKSYYVEANLDFAANKIYRRVDGKPIATIEMPAWMATAVSTTPGGMSVWVSLGSSDSYSIQTNETHSFTWSDFYCIEWEAGELPQFLGPQVIRKVPVDTVTAAAWTASTGTPTSVLKTGYSEPSAAVTAVSLTTDDPMTPGSITYNASAIPVNAVINGVTIKGRSAVTAATTGNFGVSATVSAVETADAITPMVAAQTWYDKMLVLTKTPAGLPWTQPSLAGLTVKAKPKV